MATVSERYGGMAKLLHWAVALLVLASLIYAWILPRHSDPTFQSVLLWHKSFGAAVLLLIVVRLIWRVGNPVAPAATLTPMEAWASRATHALLYATMLLLPITGYLFSSLEGQRLDLFGLVTLASPFATDRSISRPIEAIHKLGQWAVYILVGLHALAALYHHFIKRDGVLARMLPMARAQEAE
jgi:cytochrome b561